LQHDEGDAENLDKRVGKIIINLKNNFMNKAKMMLVGILIIAAAGGAVASKARFIDYQYWDGNAYQPTSSPQDCHVTGAGCQTIVDGQPTQLYRVLDGKLTWVKLS
jgi:hypothetical protein